MCIRDRDHPNAVGALGVTYFEGEGVTPSWRRARELYERAIELGNSMAVTNMQNLIVSIANVTSSGKPPHTPFPTLFVSIPTFSHLLSSRSAPPS